MVRIFTKLQIPFFPFFLDNLIHQVLFMILVILLISEQVVLNRSISLPPQFVVDSRREQLLSVDLVILFQHSSLTLALLSLLLPPVFLLPVVHVPLDEIFAGHSGRLELLGQAQIRLETARLLDRFLLELVLALLAVLELVVQSVVDVFGVGVAASFEGDDFVASGKLREFYIWLILGEKVQSAYFSVS